MSESRDTLFDRHDFQNIRERADEMAATDGMNPHWTRAYIALSDAANNLDAMLARCAGLRQLRPLTKREAED